jgi:hypothetical protein
VAAGQAAHSSPYPDLMSDRMNNTISAIITTMTIRAIGVSEGGELMSFSLMVGKKD